MLSSLSAKVKQSSGAHFRRIFALNRELQSDPCLAASKLKNKLKLIASLRTITRAITHIGWKKVRTRYTQTVRPVNRV